MRAIARSFTVAAWRAAQYGSRVCPRTIARIAAYLWASPNTVIGLLGVLLMWALGGEVRRVAGTVECSSGRLARVLQHLPAGCLFGAITLGHVILGLDAATLAALRSHEQVHVRQYERWGPAFLPAYLASSAWQWVCGRCPYADNLFEREAIDRTESYC